MTGDALLAEGQRLERPCVHLRPDGSANSFAAVWRGSGLVPPPDGDYEHWLTIDCRFLPAGIGPSAGCLSVYTDNNDRYGVAVYGPSASLSLAQGGQALHAHSTTSLPPLEAVFLRGSPVVSDWLARIGWQPEWGWNGNFPDAAVAHAYHEALRANLPIEGESVYAVLGGWHVPWPDGDWLELLDRPLLVMTLAESEPWVEVFNLSSEYRVIQRVS